MICLAVLVVPLLAWSVFQLAVRYWPPSHWRPAQADIEARHGVRVLLEDFDLPDSFRRQHARYRPTLPFERASVLASLSMDLSRYPEGFVSRYVDSIVVLRSLELNGLAYGGTYDAPARRIYIVAGWLGDDGSRDEAMGIHHELSSLLMKAHPDIFDPAAWAALNPAGFAYRFGRSGADNLASGQTDLVGGPGTWADGFLCQYGELTLEDDINTFAQYLVAPKNRWPELADRYPGLAAKMSLLASWYRRVGFQATVVGRASSP